MTASDFVFSWLSSRIRIPYSFSDLWKVFVFMNTYGTYEIFVKVVDLRLMRSCDLCCEQFAVALGSRGFSLSEGWAENHGRLGAGAELCEKENTLEPRIVCSFCIMKFAQFAILGCINETR